MKGSRFDPYRIRNGIRKIAAGLTPFGESVWPGAGNDLFVAHESIYRFAATWCRDRDVLDAGCGTGYGSAILGAVARSVCGVDLDRRSIRYARKRYGSTNVRFEVADLEHLRLPPGSVDVVVASNSLEHLSRPEEFVRNVASVTRHSGSFIVAVPPVYSEHDASVHRAIHYHRSNLKVLEWMDLLDRYFHVECYRHSVRSTEIQPDFGSHRPTRLVPSDFVFQKIESPMQEPSITALFVGRRDARSGPVVVL